MINHKIMQNNRTLGYYDAHVDECCNSKIIVEFTTMQ